MTAKFIGVGVGPGDPELITLKAARYIQSADVLSFIVNHQGQSQAKNIAISLIDNNDQHNTIPLAMPMSDDRTAANKVYDQTAVEIERCVKQGKTVVFLCEGDPLFFGSFAYLLERLQTLIPCEIVPGISSINAAAASLSKPLALLSDSFAVVSGRHNDETIRQTLLTHDSVAIMKAGRSRARLITLLKETGRDKDAHYLEYIGREQQKICHDIHELPNSAGPYFSLFVITSQRSVES